MTIAALAACNSSQPQEEEKTEKHEETKDTPTKEPVLSTPMPLVPAPDLDKPSKTNFKEPIQKREKERNQAVQKYLDFFDRYV